MLHTVVFQNTRKLMGIKDRSYIEGILPKGRYLACVSMAGRALLAGYNRYKKVLYLSCNLCDLTLAHIKKVQWLTAFQCNSHRPLGSTPKSKFTCSNSISSFRQTQYSISYDFYIMFEDHQLAMSHILIEIEQNRLQCANIYYKCQQDIRRNKSIN